MPQVSGRKVHCYLDTGDKRVFLRRATVDEAEALVVRELAVPVHDRKNQRLQYILLAPDPDLLPKLAWPLRAYNLVRERVDNGHRVLAHRPVRECASAVIDSVTAQLGVVTSSDAEVIAFRPRTKRRQIQTQVAEFEIAA